MSVIKFPLFVALLMFVCGAQATTIRVSIDRNPVAVSDSFQLTFSAEQAPDGEPDFSPLQENFVILNQQHSSSSSWINGQSSRTIQWILTVMAKKTGALLIPPVAFGDDHSEPLTIGITEEQNAAGNSSEELFLEVQATPEKPYVQAQVLYTLRFFRRVQITQASLNDPEIDGVLVEKLGEDSNYRTRINGVEYMVTERNYALFPQKSGKLAIPPLTLMAEIVANSRPSFNGFFNPQVTQSKRISSKAIELDVQGIPPLFAGNHWLAASALTLKQQWSGDGLQVKVGEPLTRTLTLQVQGATVGQLPELGNLPSPDGLKTYPDQPLLKEQKQADGLSALREEKIAYIPSRPGRFELPELQVVWFNTRTQKIETATLPQVTLVASGDVQNAAPQPASTPQITATPNAATPTTAGELQSVAPSQAEQPFWFWLALALASGWLLTIVWIVRILHKPTPVPVAAAPARDSVEDAAQAIKAACAVDDAQAVKSALLRWGKARYQADNLADIARHCEARLRDEILALNRYLYAPQTDTHQVWQGKQLSRYLAEHTARQRVATPSDEPLQPLHKL